MRKKLVSLLLAVSTAAMLLAGCGAQEQEDSTASSQQASSEQQESSPASETQTEDGEYPVIRMGYLIVGDVSLETEIEERLNEILREKAGAEVDLIGIEFGNLSTQMNLMLTGGDTALDLFNSFWYTSESNLVANGQVIALDELMESDGADILAQYEGYEEYLDCARIDGQLYGIPSIYAWSCENLYLVSTEASDAAGIDWSQVNDLDTLTDAMIQMKEASPDKYFIPGSTQTYWIPKDIDYLGDTNFLGVLTDPTNSTTVENYYESEYFLDFLEHVKQWKEAGLISPDPMSNTDATLVNLQYGVVDGTPGYNWDTEVGRRNSEVNYGVELYGTALSEPLATSGDVTTYMWHISSFCEDPAAAMRVLNVLYSDVEAAQLVGMGIEGKNYVLDENGQMTFPEGKTLWDAGWGCSGSALWPNITLCKTWYYEPVDVYEQMKEKNASAEKSLALGFQFDSTPVADQMAACANVVAQYYLPLINAEADIDTTLPVFQEQLKSAGIDEIIAEKQRQLDEWLASK